MAFCGTSSRLCDGDISGDTSGRTLWSSAIEWAPPTETCRTGIAPMDDGSSGSGTLKGLPASWPRRPWLGREQLTDVSRF
jgi:hypothetical protein